VDAVEVAVKAVNEEEATREALRVTHDSEQLVCAELNSLRSEAARAYDSVFGIASSRVPLTSHLGELPSRVERVVADTAYFG
jgi:hypothetical protein